MCDCPQGTKPPKRSVSTILLKRSSSWRERAKMQVGRQKALDSRTKVQVSLTSPCSHATHFLVQL